jgi:hypothetical protein
MGKRYWRTRLLLLAVCSPLVQCSGEESISSKLDFTFHPDSPVVILSDFTLNPGSVNEKLITGPWFAVSYGVTNNSDKTITIQSLHFTITAMTLSGGIVTTTAGVDPSDYENQFCVPHEPVYLDEVAPGATVTPCFVVYVDGLSEDVINYSYQVRVDVQGWIGTAAAPEDRLEKTATFTTQ